MSGVLQLINAVFAQSQDERFCFFFPLIRRQMKPCLKMEYGQAALGPVLLSGSGLFPSLLSADPGRHGGNRPGAREQKRTQHAS